jgi:hypothetical protein
MLRWMALPFGRLLTATNHILALPSRLRQRRPPGDDEDNGDLENPES